MSMSTTAVAAVRRDRPPSRGSAGSSGNFYGLLLRRVRNAGLLERRGGFYVWRITATTLLLAAGRAAFVWVGDSWWQLAVAVFLAFVFTQVGFIGHEAGHQQITAEAAPEFLAGIQAGGRRSECASCPPHRQGSRSG